MVKSQPHLQTECSSPKKTDLQSVGTFPVINISGGTTVYQSAQRESLYEERKQIKPAADCTLLNRKELE